MSDQQIKEKNFIHIEKTPSADLLSPEKEQETRAERIAFLRAEVERLFPGDNLASLRQDIERSFSVPQYGKYHNEGMLMDTHLFRILQTIQDVKNGIVHEAVPTHLAQRMHELANRYEEEFKKYTFLHDISKADSLRLQFKDDQPDKDITWEEYQAMVPDHIQNNPVEVKKFFEELGIEGISYYHEGANHGPEGAKKMEIYGDELNLPAMVNLMVSRHESAHHFSKVKADTYKKFFEDFSVEEELWILFASYIDTIASLSKNGEPNLNSFQNMVTSAQNYHSIDVAEKALEAYPEISKSILQKELTALRRSDATVGVDPDVLIDDLIKKCSKPKYNKEKIKEQFNILKAVKDISDDVVQSVVNAVSEETGEFDASILSSIDRTLRQTVKYILELSRQENTYERTRRNFLKAEQLFDFHARKRFIEIEKFTLELETADVSKKEVKVKLFWSAFENGATTEKLGLLEERGILDEVVPEFARNKHLTQDSRFHGTETVGQHLINSVEAVDRVLEQGAQFSSPRFELLVRLATFFHDIGKNEDEETAPQKIGKEGRGHRVVTRRKGEEFDRVRFLGHQGEGKSIFEKRIQALQAELGVEKKLTAEEILMCALWIEHHMKAIFVAREFQNFTSEQLAEQIVNNAYPVELLNARIPLADVLRATMMIQEMELFSTFDCEEKTEWIQAWQKVKEQVELMLPLLEYKNRRELLIPLVTGRDLCALGIPTGSTLRKILHEVEVKQLSGEIVDRNTALREVVNLALERRISVEEAQFDVLVGQGAYKEMRARKENLRLVADQDRGSYHLRLYETTPLRQFTKDTDIQELEKMVFSGNFPHLVEHMKEHEISIADLKSLIIERGFANLLQMEFFVKEYCSQGELLMNVGQTRSPSIRAIEIERVFPTGEKGTIVVNNGYQGVKDHRGAGVIHIGEQRLEALKRFYRKEGESEEAMVKRFLENGVIHVLGTAALEIPSDHDPKRYGILIAPVADENGKKFASVIIDKSTEKYTVITTLFQESPKEMRLDLRNMIRRLKEKAKFDEAQLSICIANANKLLESIGEKLLQLEDFNQTQSNTPEVKKASPPKAKEAISIPAELKPLGGILRNKMPEVTKLWETLKSKQDGIAELEQFVDQELRSKLQLSEEQIQAVLNALKT